MARAGTAHGLCTRGHNSSQLALNLNLDLKLHAQAEQQEAGSSRKSELFYTGERLAQHQRECFAQADSKRADERRDAEVDERVRGAEARRAVQCEHCSARQRTQRVDDEERLSERIEQLVNAPHLAVLVHSWRVQHDLRGADKTQS